MNSCNKSSYFLQEEYALDNPFRQEVDIGNVDDDDTHVPIVAKFQAMINDLQRLNALARQHFDERIAAQAEVETKQLKFIVEKIKAMFECAQAVINAADEQAIATSKQIKVVAAE